MSVEAFAEGDLFRITIVKYLATNPDRKWGNNYEARAKVAGVLSDISALASKLVAFEREIHFEAVQFDRVRMSTWEQDSVPYDPTVFVSLPLAVTGNADIGAGQLVALNTCWDVARFPLYGRFGHIYYRGCLTESRVEAPAGRNVLQDPAGMQEILEVAISTAAADEIFNGSDTTWEIVMINKLGDQVRPLAALTSRGVATVPFEHTWFNRTTGGG